VLLVAAACTPQQQPQSKQQNQAAWEMLGSWSGRGNKQTDSFTSESGALRIQWEARQSDTSSDGKFRLTMHSSISGRPLSAAIVDHKGAGKGTAFVSEDPRVFFVLVESQNLDWTFTVEERVR
jgi:hypothetical protein